MPFILGWEKKIKVESSAEGSLGGDYGFHKTGLRLRKER